MAPLFPLPYLLSNIPLLAILLIILMSFSIFHDMIDLREGGDKRLVYKLFKRLYKVTKGDERLYKD